MVIHCEENNDDSDNDDTGQVNGDKELSSLSLFLFRNSDYNV